MWKIWRLLLMPSFLPTQLLQFTLQLSQSSLSHLQFIENAVARILTRTQKRHHIIPVLVSWFPERFWIDFIDFKILLFVNRALHGLTPSYITNLLQTCSLSRSHSHESQNTDPNAEHQNSQGLNSKYILIGLFKQSKEYNIHKGKMNPEQHETHEGGLIYTETNNALYK